MSQPIQATTTSAGDMLNQGMQSITNTLNDAKNQISQSFNDFSSQPNASSEFSFSNTIVAKFAFLLLIIILFMFFINLGINLITYMTSPGNNPYLVKGMRGGTNSLNISQNPNVSGSVSLMRSNNESRGAEFTWSIWLFIDDLSQIPSTYQHIFNKGDSQYGADGISAVNNAPGLYLGNGGDNNPAKNPRNTLRIIMDTVGSKTSAGSTGNKATPSSGLFSGTTPGPSNSEQDFMNQNKAIVDVPNVPLKKWFHVAVRLENSVLDIYINGTIDQRQRLTNVPKQNYYDVNVSQNGGFTGNLSDLRYFNSALNVFQINTIVSNGPNLNTNTQYAGEIKLDDYHYLSNQWYKI
jgi:hypothetical protein